MSNAKNKGFSLVELMVVIAIMAVLTGLAGIGFGVVTGAKIKTASKEVKSALLDVRTTTMGKEGNYVAVLQDNGNKKMVSVGKLDEKGKFLSSRDIELDSSIVITAQLSSGEKTLDASGLVFSFKKSSGSFDTCKNLSGTDLGTCKSITMVRGGRTYVLKLAQATGKVSIE